MSNNQKTMGIVIGFMLGSMALLILSFYKQTKQLELLEKIEAENKIKLIQSIEDTCSPTYPVVYSEINGDSIVIECRTE